MTKVVFYRHEGAYYGFRVSGHAGFADAGEDVLCAAISAMTMLVINTLEVSYAGDVDCQIDEKSTTITVFATAALMSNPDEKQRYAVNGLILGYYLQLVDMTEDYYNNLEVTIEDRAV